LIPTVSLFFAVFAGIFSERAVVLRRNPGLQAIRREKKQQKRPLFRRCFSLFLHQRTAIIEKIALMSYPDFCTPMSQ
jgi:hypothetical protein